MHSIAKTAAPVLFLVLGVLLLLTTSFATGGWFVSLARPIGSALIAAGVVWFAYILSFSRVLDEVRYEGRRWARACEESLEAVRSTSSSGVERVYENQGKALMEYSTIVRHTRHQVNILGMTLIGLWWIPEFEGSTMEAMERGVKFRILTLDPKSPAVHFLSRQEMRTDDSFQAELSLAMRRLNELRMRSPSPDAIQIRIFKGVPSSFLLITDDRMFFAPYLHSASVLASPCFEVRAKAGPIYQAYRSYFEALWVQQPMVE